MHVPHCCSLNMQLFGFASAHQSPPFPPRRSLWDTCGFCTALTHSVISKVQISAKTYLNYPARRSLWDTCGWATPFVVVIVAFLLLGALWLLWLLLGTMRSLVGAFAAQQLHSAHALPHCN